MKNERMRAGIIGLGRIGSGLDDPWFDAHLRDESWRARPCTMAGHLVDHPAVDLVAGCDLDPERRAAFGERWGISSVFADHRAMLDQTQLDIICVATRGADRHRPTMDAIAARPRAILLEKHLAASLSESDEIVQAATAAGIPVIVNQTFRLEPNVRRLRDAIHDGLIGDLRGMHAHVSGRLIHMGTHVFDLFHFFGGPSVDVIASVVPGSDPDDPQASGVVVLESGLHAHFDARPHSAPAILEIYGSAGTARIGNDANVTIEVFLPKPLGGGAAQYYPPLLASVPFPGANAEADRIGNIRQGRNLTRLTIDEVVACALTGRDPISNARHALAALEVAIAAMTASDRRQAVALPLAERARRTLAI